jgi:hypothetical protein
MDQKKTLRAHRLLQLGVRQSSVNQSLLASDDLLLSGSAQTIESCDKERIRFIAANVAARWNARSLLSNVVYFRVSRGFPWPGA